MGAEVTDGMKYKVFLFDADGVILKDEGLFTDKAKEQGLISSTEKTQSFFEGVFRECLIGKADLKKELAKVIKDWGWQGAVDELIDFWFSVGDDLDEKMGSYIAELKKQGVTCYMTTDQEKYRGQYLRKKFGNLFEDFFISGEIGINKKDPGYFEYVYDKVKNKVSDKSEIVFIDDALHNVENARAFGIDAIHYHNFKSLEGVLS